MEKEFCCDAHVHKPVRLYEFCLLLVLCEGTGYGYSLADKLREFGFSDEDLNTSALYRTLRKMETRGLVRSIWEEGGQGPKRRIYEITQDGRTELDRWIEILKFRRARINKMIETYEKKQRFGDRRK